MSKDLELYLLILGLVFCCAFAFGFWLGPIIDQLDRRGGGPKV
jgi:hypothetical protein